MARASGRTAKSRSRAKRGKGTVLRQWRRRVVVILVVLALTPAALLNIYRLPVVHPVSTLMVKNLVTLAGYDRRWVPIDDIAPALVYSVMMSEDAKFCSHSGVDWGALNAVIDDAVDGEPTRGASTIPMQTVKNLFLWQGRSYLRKALEIPLATIADLILSKRRLMEIYLNIAEWGPGIYGAEAAAQHHFHRPAVALTPAQAALLAVTLPNPALRNPAKPNRSLLRLARVIELRAEQAGAYVGCVR